MPSGTQAKPVFHVGFQISNSDTGHAITDIIAIINQQEVCEDKSAATRPSFQGNGPDEVGLRAAIAGEILEFDPYLGLSISRVECARRSAASRLCSQPDAAPRLQSQHRTGLGCPAVSCAVHRLIKT
jgi:hypothetical protein